MKKLIIITILLTLTLPAFAYQLDFEIDSDIELHKIRNVNLIIAKTTYYYTEPPHYVYTIIPLKLCYGIEGYFWQSADNNFDDLVAALDTKPHTWHIVGGRINSTIGDGIAQSICSYAMIRASRWGSKPDKIDGVKVD